MKRKSLITLILVVLIIAGTGVFVIGGQTLIGKYIEPKKCLMPKGCPSEGKTPNLPPELSEAPSEGVAAKAIPKEKIIKEVPKELPKEEVPPFVPSYELVQGEAEVGKPVSWTKSVVVEENETMVDIIASLPEDAFEVKIYDSTSNAELNVNSTLHAGQNLRIEFKTSAPQIDELPVLQTASGWSKFVTVRSDSSLHYKDVFAFTNIDETNESLLHVYHLLEGSRVEVTTNPDYSVNFVDTNNNKLIDRVEWNVPLLSEQQFEIAATNVTNATNVTANQTTFGAEYASGVIACITLDADDGVYYLQNDISGLQSGQNYCIDIIGYNVTLYCNGYSLTGSKSGVGIKIDAPYAKLYDCNVYDYQTGISTWSYALIKDTKIRPDSASGDAYGLYIEGDYSDFTNVTVSFGSWQWTYGAYITVNSDYNTIKDSSFTGFPYYSTIKIDSSSGNKVVNNSFVNTTGVYVGATAAVIEGNNFNNITRLSAIYLNGGKNNVVRSNIINIVDSSIEPYGITVYRSNNSLVENNYIDDVERGIYVYMYGTPSPVEIINNTIANADYGLYYSYATMVNSSENDITSSNTCIYLIDVDNSTLEGERATNCGDYGIRLAGDDSNLELKNSVITGDGIGVDAVSSPYLTISNISVSDFTSYGIHLYNSGYPQLEYASLNNTGGVYIQNSSDCIISNSWITNSLMDGVRIESTKCDLTSLSISNSNSSDKDLFVWQGSSITGDFSVGGVSMDVNFTDVSVGSTTNPGNMPSDYTDIGKFVNITNTSSSAWAEVTIYYNDSDWQDAGIYDESTLRMWKYNGSWYELPQSGVDTANNYVYS
ncbi:MAG: right-handed parallel beta-helix repeat-containing protein, partial [Nanoarchaeota archaeon]|nr:right-handed parallel beta-helix repeat-containing protein [Nanoarchaeota archaeon]